MPEHLRVLVDGITGGFHLLSSLSSGDPEDV